MCLSVTTKVRASLHLTLWVRTAGETWLGRVDRRHRLRVLYPALLCEPPLSQFWFNPPVFHYHFLFLYSFASPTVWPSPKLKGYSMATSIESSYTVPYPRTALFVGSVSCHLRGKTGLFVNLDHWMCVVTNWEVFFQKTHSSPNAWHI